MITTDNLIEEPLAKPTPRELGISEIQYNNFVKMRNYLRTGQPEHFDMWSWHCCVVGTAERYLGIRRAHDDWHEYTKEVFGVNTATFMFLFGSTWKEKDNTSKGAADRIDAFLRGECIVK